MIPKVSNDPNYWQTCAEEAWSMAAEMIDAHCKAMMVVIAQSYEDIAKSVERSRREPR
jgi:hypothetical protein